MPDLPTIGGGPGDVASTPASTTGITITANSSVNTKATSWTELIASTAYDTNWIMLHFTAPSAQGASGGYLVDIGVGASTAEQVLIPNLLLHWASNSMPKPAVYLFPLRIPRSTRLSARCQCATGSGTLVVSAHTFSSPIGAPPGLGRVEAVGADTSTSRGTLLNDPGGSAHTDGTWTQLIASTEFSYRWLSVAIVNVADVAWAAVTTHLTDLAVGANGSEVVLVSDLLTWGNSNTDGPTPLTFNFPMNVASGSRMAGRNRASVTTTGDRRAELAVYGVG